MGVTTLIPPGKIKRILKGKETFKNEYYDMMGVEGASAAYSRSTSTARQSHKSQLISAVHKRKMSKQQVLTWGADAVIQFLEILWDTSHENYYKKNARGHN